MSDSRISGLYRRPIGERIEALEARGWISSADAETLRQGRHVLAAAAADRMVENTIGVFGLPYAIAPNFIVNDREYIVPMVVEEPSVVAALSNAARMARASGGFHAWGDESLLIGQIILSELADPKSAAATVLEQRPALIDAANAVHPRLVARGGGVRDIEIGESHTAEAANSLTVHLLVDTCDAMGANLVNTICESLAPRLVNLCGGNVVLRILSNLADRSLVRASVRYPPASLGANPQATRDGVVAASRVAESDPYRATTHNKGIMNGIDALAIATGNDWRAIEAGAHAYAAASGRYRPLATWAVADDGALSGEICLPLKPGIVGGTLGVNPAAALSLRMIKAESAQELAGLMAAVGLAQNFAALQALATTGIQAGHMRLHARSAAPRRRAERPPLESAKGRAAGKVIVLGEHAVVYGKHALALPIPDAVAARVELTQGETSIAVPDWNLRHTLSEPSAPLAPLVRRIIEGLDASEAGLEIEVYAGLPPGMGLGASAALAVALIRGIAEAVGRAVNDAEVNALAFECEKLAHETPSGVDNTIATYAVPMLFRRDSELRIDELEPPEPIPMLVALSSHRGLTTAQVAGVRERREQMSERYDALFAEIDTLSLAGAAALESGDYAMLGRLMNICHGLLNAIEVSTPEIEGMVEIARAAGASGAKLTGAGGGGSIVALCPGRIEAVSSALEAAGFRTLVFSQGGGVS